MTDYNLQFSPEESTLAFDYSKWFFFKPTVVYVGKEEAMISSLLSSQILKSYFAEVRRDLVSNLSNLRKYPRFNEEDWE